MFQKKNILNLQGYRCPEFLLNLRKKLHFSFSTQKIVILTDDISNQRDIITFCYFMKYKIITYKNTKTPYQYVIQKTFF
ncbi:sulfurtransferase TusA family protein [Buchnera aphidicola]|uniref:sulfurtransferase TusA family protein n=1 Tax=Buchnera aphidicola TaxID=9 RepID=UPI0031B6F877